jgi:hypothetical protein
VFENKEWMGIFIFREKERGRHSLHNDGTAPQYFGDKDPMGWNRI